MYNFVFDLRCPDSSQWNLRANVYNCSEVFNYLCLYDDFNLNYSESCEKEYFARRGTKILRSPVINVGDCSNNRYQPLKFTTNGNSDCVFLKSFCEEEGQVIANNGTSSTDRSCRCDYTRGYVYVTPPSDICSCVPSSEDCTGDHV